jgi:hypothetical protein
MEFIDLKFSIEVKFSSMTKEQYKEFVRFFEEQIIKNEPIDAKEVVSRLSLDKRPFLVSSINSPRLTNDLISNAEVTLVS